MSHVVQVTMQMSADAALGIANGTMVRYGGVVYNVTGGIVEHLIDSILPEAENEVSAVAAKASNSIRFTLVKHISNPKALITIGVGTVILSGIGIVFYIKSKNKSNSTDNSQTPKCIADYNDSVVAYLDAIDNGNVSLDNIKSVIKSIDKLNESNDITIGFAHEKSETLINFVYDYTKKLAEVNSFELINFEKSTSISAYDTLGSLRQYLEIQTQIFEEVA